jgi:metal-responsive CopG/Arc/MetJ family transcriptional regulator
MKNSRQRGAISKNIKEAKPILVWFPLHIISAIDDAVNRTDLDRSKFIRMSVRNYLTELREEAQP